MTTFFDLSPIILFIVLLFGAAYYVDKECFTQDQCEELYYEDGSTYTVCSTNRDFLNYIIGEPTE